VSALAKGVIVMLAVCLKELAGLVNLSHLKAITDDTGVLQFTFYGVPDPKSGYTTDDNARALIVAAMHFTQTGDEEALSLAQRYLAFLRYAQRDDGRFHNFIRYDRHYGDEVGSEDCFGRSLWALGTALNSGLPEKLKKAALTLWERSLPVATRLRHPRPKAYTLVGLHEAAQVLNGHCPTLLGLAQQLADDLCSAYLEHAERCWRWFEDTLTYDNAALCEGMLRAYLLTGERRYCLIGLEALRFLNAVCWDAEKDCVSLVGNRGWYRKGGTKAIFAQQPTDAMWLCWANLTAWQVTGEETFRTMAKACWEWFLGRNLLGVALYDAETGACHDGLEPQGANENRGAESTIAALLTFLRMAQPQRCCHSAKR
jgi:hypothetical protein